MSSGSELKEFHIVDIPTEENENQKKLLLVASAIQQHPFTEISGSPGHLLLLKLWQREEYLNGKRMSTKESRMDWIKSEIFELCCCFLLFQGFFLTILFTSSSSSSFREKWWWVPGAVSLWTSVVLVWLVQVKLYRYWNVESQLQKQRVEGRSVTRLIQELRMKGGSFELGKDPYCGRKMKSSSVEIKWKPITWFTQYRVAIFLVCFTGLVFPVSRLILCGRF